MRKKTFNYSMLILSVASSLILFSCTNSKNKSESYNGDKNISSVNDSISLPQENPYANAEIEIKVFKNDTVSGSHLQGFGYDVYLNDKLYVHQPNIPAVSGNTGFSSEEQANKVGEFIAWKIKHNIMPPSVTPQELDSLGVLK